jgi:lysophospholipase L1-like esterase
MQRIIAVAGAALLAIQSTNAQGPGVVDATPSQRLVILGASYAGHWGVSELPGFEVVNKGVGGEQSHEMLARFDRDVIGEGADTVLIWGHINNVHRAPNGDYAATVQRIKGDYQSMVARARSAGIDVILATEVTLTEAVGLIDRAAAFVGWLRGKQGYSARINEHVQTVNEWLRSYAAEQEIPLLDFEAVFDDGNGFRKREYTSEDGSHITQAGYEALTRYAREALSARER